VSQNYAAIRDNDELDALVDRVIAYGRPFAFDIESGYTGDTDPRWPKLATLHQHPRWLYTGFSFAAVTNPEAEEITDRIGWARYVPIAHDDNGNIPDAKRAAKALWRLLQSGLGVAYNMMFEQHGDARWFRDMLWDDPDVGHEVRKSDGFFPFLSDAIIEVAMTGLYPPAGIAFHIAKGVTGYGLKSMTQRVFKHKMTTFEDQWKGEPKSVPRAYNNRDSHKPETIEYGCEDSFWTLALHLKHYDMVKDNIVFQAEIDLIPVLCRMERTALLIDWDLLTKKAVEAKVFGATLNEEIQEELSRRLGRTVAVNLDSAPQMQKILFDELGLPVINRSKKTGAPSTDATSLAAISKRDKTVKRVLQYREISTLLKSFLNRYPKSLNYLGNGRAVPNHNQLGAVTGRFSVDGVSYQQWPKPYKYELESGSTFEFNFRDALLSPEGFRIVGYDFSQVELRMIAGLSGEETLVASFLAGEDIHVRTAAQMLGIPIDQVTKAQRAIGKTLNFAIVYGAGPARIANMLTSPENPMSVDDAKRLLAAYFNAFPKIKAWLESTRYNARASHPHMVYTPFGRKVRIWEYEADPYTIQRYAKADEDLSLEEAKQKANGIISQGDRLATNAPPQGGAADYMKIGMVRAQKAIDEAGLQDKVLMVMTVHDALEFYVHESISTQDVIDLISPAVTFGEELFPDILAGYPPIKADWHEGYTWGHVFEIELDEQGHIEHYSHEDEKKVVHYYRSFKDAVEGVTFEPQPTAKQKETTVDAQVDKPVEKPQAQGFMVTLQPGIEQPDIQRLARGLHGLPRAEDGVLLRIQARGQVKSFDGLIDKKALAEYLQHVRIDVPHVGFTLQRTDA
jgi:DNA polymerase I-like protein with 3'-5' exonuclease and polymerase domains